MGETMQTDLLRDRLTQALSLESALFELEQMQSCIGSKLTYVKPVKKRMKRKLPKDRSGSIVKPQEPELLNTHAAEKMLAAGLAFGIGAAAYSIAYAMAFYPGFLPLHLLVAISCLLLMVRCIHKGLKLKQEADEKLASYAKALADYEEALAQAKENYRESSEAYAYEYAANNAAFQEMERTSRADFDRCREALNRLAENAAESRKLRSKLYESGWLYPKYQNLTAVSSLYDYVSSGRADALEGPAGAYNLYESELMAGQIRQAPVSVPEDVSAFKMYQYTLWEQLDKIQESLRSAEGQTYPADILEEAAVRAEEAKRHAEIFLEAGSR